MKPFLFLSLLWLTSCTSPKIFLESSFKDNSKTYEVKGRNGFLIKQKVSFGKFKTNYIKRGFTLSYNIPFIIQFSGAREKLAFELTDSIAKCRVNCFGKIANKDVNLFNEYFGINLSREDIFVGSIVYQDTSTWHFFIENASNTNPFGKAHGFAINGDKKIEIESIRELETKNTALSRLEIYGYNFNLNATTVGAVEIINKGRVVIGYNLPNEYELVIGSLSCALLIKRNINDES